MRRFVDILASLAALVVLSPVLAAIAIWIALDSPGSPFYRAVRIGKGGKKFRMWKFRTMYKDQPAEASPITGRDDPRVTRAGAILRRTKLDEVPQFLNVLAGDMTLVGPRPESPEFVRCYTAEQRLVLEVKPGVTGVVQVISGEESDSIPPSAPDRYYMDHLMGPKLAIDLDYLRTRTAWSDLCIIGATAALIVRAMFGRPRDPDLPAAEAEPAEELVSTGRYETFDHRSMPE